MFSFLKELFFAIGEMFGFFKQKELIEAGKALVIEAQTSKGGDLVLQAEKARQEAAISSAAVPVTDSLPDDGFRRD